MPPRRGCARVFAPSARALMSQGVPPCLRLLPSQGPPQWGEGGGGEPPAAPAEDSPIVCGQGAGPAAEPNSDLSDLRWLPRSLLRTIGVSGRAPTYRSVSQINCRVK